MFKNLDLNELFNEFVVSHNFFHVRFLIFFIFLNISSLIFYYFLIYLKKKIYSIVDDDDTIDEFMFDYPHDVFKSGYVLITFSINSVVSLVFKILE